MSNNFDFTLAIKEGLRLGKERLEIKDRINKILQTFADDLQKILSQNSPQNIFVQKKHIVVREKGSTLAAIYGLGVSERAIKEEYELALKEAPILKDDDSINVERKLSYINIRYFMLNLLDRKDRISSGASLEVRVPFCDKDLVELLYNVPISYKNKDGVFNLEVDGTFIYIGSTPNIFANLDLE